MAFPQIPLPIGEVTEKRPSEEMLLAYATGALEEPLRSFVEVHLALCPASAATVRAAREIGGALLADAAPVPMSGGALEALLQRIDSEPADPLEPVLEPDIVRLPAVIRARAAGQRWQRGTPGLSRISLNLPDEPSSPAFNLLRLQPGSAIPPHTHAGKEMILVLEGGFADAFDAYRAGEISAGDETLTHTPVAEAGEVCYAVSLHDAPLRFKGLWGLLQRVAMRR